MPKNSSKQEMTGSVAYVALKGSQSGIGATVFTVVCVAALIGYLGGPIAWGIIALFLIVFFWVLWRAKRQDDEDRRTAAIRARNNQHQSR